MQAQIRAVENLPVRAEAREPRKVRARAGRQRRKKVQPRNVRSAKGLSVEEWLTYRDAAKLLNRTPGSLRVDVCVGKLGIPYYKVGGKVLFKRSELLAWLQSCKRGGVQ